MIVEFFDLWWPLRWSKRNGYKPIPFQAYLAWAANNARQIQSSRTVTDPFPDGALT